jgi:hypothetical protein
MPIPLTQVIVDVLTSVPANDRRLALRLLGKTELELAKQSRRAVSGEDRGALLDAVAFVADVVHRIVDDPRSGAQHLASTTDTFALLPIKAATQRLGVSRDWISRHQDRLPWLIRLPSGRFRVHPQLLEEWIQAQQRRKDPLL